MLYSFSSVLFFQFLKFFSASSPPPPVQTGEDLSLTAFSWAFPAHKIVAVGAVNNTAGMLFDRSLEPRHRTATGAMDVE